MSPKAKAPEGSQPHPALVAALRRLLRPVVRLLLAHQVTYPFLAALLKQVYIDTADRELTIEGKRQTDSRLSLLTGIHRKDVRRLRATGENPESPPGVVSLGAQLVARWTGRPEFQDAEGRPLPLPRIAGPGRPSFEGLVESLSKDIRPRAVLDEWRRLGVVEIDDDERVQLVVDAFVPQQGFEEKAFYFGRNLHDHAAASVRNLLGQKPPLLERSVYYGRLSAASVEELAALSERVGMEALQAVNRRSQELQQHAAGDEAAKQRMTFGIYFYREASEPADSDEEPEDA